jgi:hypothetical protein
MKKSLKGNDGHKIAERGVIFREILKTLFVITWAAVKFLGADISSTLL